MKRLFALALFCASLAPAQTVSPIVAPHQNFLDAAGFPCVGCSLYTYAAGSTTPLATYKNSTGTANTNPIVLDASGGAYIWTTAGPYKFVLLETSGATVWTADNVQGLPVDATARTNAASALTAANAATTAAGAASTAAAAAQTTANAALPAFGMNAKQGTGTKVQAATGTTTTNDLIKYNAAGDAIDSGVLVTSLTPTYTCGNTTTCGNTLQASPRIVWGAVALSSGTPSTAVVTGMTAWTGTTSYACTVTNTTTQANPLKVANTSSTSITITGPNTVTDVAAYICVGN